MIVGKSFSELYPKKSIAKGDVIFEVKGLSYLDKLHDISFSLRAGEIVAFFGLLGSGTHLLFNVLFDNTPDDWVLHSAKMSEGDFWASSSRQQERMSSGDPQGGGAIASVSIIAVRHHYPSFHASRSFARTRVR